MVGAGAGGAAGQDLAALGQILTQLDGVLVVDILGLIHTELADLSALAVLLRGSGLTGLAGIRPVQGRRVRPLLCVGRDEIREYLTAEHMDWCEDSTNQSADYTRNRIRSQVLPLLKETVNEQAEEHILQAGQIIGQADEYLRQRAAEIWRVAVSRQQESRDSESGARRNFADEM